MPRRTLVGMGVGLPLWVPIAVAVIASAGVLVAATLTAYATARRERAARRAEHESERLEELRDAAVELRDATLADPSEEEFGRRLWHASSAFVVRREAVAAPRVRELALDWERLVLAPRTPTRDDAEEAAWYALLRQLGRSRRTTV